MLDYAKSVKQSFPVTMKSYYFRNNAVTISVTISVARPSVMRSLHLLMQFMYQFPVSIRF